MASDVREESFETEIKVIVVGNGGVGKSSMIRRFAKGLYTDAYKKTIGVDYLEKKVYNSTLKEDVTMMLWDTAGQDEFSTITRTYYRGAGAAVFAFSTTDRNSFTAISEWKERVTNECGDIAMVLVQNKMDLLDQAVVTSAEAEALAQKLGIKFYRISVKDDMNVSPVFDYLCEAYLKNQNNPHPGGKDVSFLETSSKPIQVAAASDEPDSPGAAAPEPAASGPPKPSKQRTGGKKNNCVIA